MKVQTIKILSAILLIVYVCACEKDNLQSGVIKGSVRYSKEGVMVMIENQAIQKSTFTDKSGKYYFTGMQRGYYDITFSKEGYGTVVIKIYLFIGIGSDAVVEEVVLYNMPETAFTNASVSITSGVNGFSVFEGYVVSPPGSFYRSSYGLRFYFGKSSEISENMYLYNTSNNFYGKTVPGDSAFFKTFLPDMVKGDVWYCAIYTANFSAQKKAFPTIELTVK